MKLISSIWLALSLVVSGCVPLGLPQATYTPPPTETPTTGDKPTPSPSEHVVLMSGYLLPLVGGLTNEGRAQLLAGQTGYFFVAFSTSSNEAHRAALQQAGAEEISPGTGDVYVMIVPSTTLTVFETLNIQGALNFAGPAPIEGRLSADLADLMQRSVPSDILQVSIVLYVPIDDDKRAELSQWLTISGESGEFLGGNIENQNVSRLLQLPYLQFVDELKGLSP